jgi:hypothetical protein
LNSSHWKKLPWKSGFRSPNPNSHRSSIELQPTARNCHGNLASVPHLQTGTEVQLNFSRWKKPPSASDFRFQIQTLNEIEFQPLKGTAMEIGLPFPKSKTVTEIELNFSRPQETATEIAHPFSNSKQSPKLN